MKKSIVLLIAILLCFSCEPNLKPEKPDNLIPKDKMTDLLFDMFIVTSAKGIKRTKFESFGLDPEDYILKKYNIDSLQFAESNNYYAYDVELYKSMIEDVKAKLSSEKEKYEAIEKKEEEERKRKRDSLIEKRKNSKITTDLEKKQKLIKS